MSIGPYIVDFFCAECRLPIELDGAPHFEELAIERDAKRTAYLEGEGIHVMRFDNRIIYEDLEKVFGANSAERFSGCLIYHPVCASKEGGLFLYGADTPPGQEGKFAADISSSALLGHSLKPNFRRYVAKAR